MLKSGCKGYILKHGGKDELVQAIRTVHRGEQYISKVVSDTLIKSMMPGFDRRTSETIPQLTKREKEILQLILEEYTTSEIAEKLFLSLSTVETHRKNLLSKAGVRNTAGLVRVTLEQKLLDK